MNKDFSGHLAALLTIFIWGTTFISTEILLTDFKPIEILFFRFLIGLFILILIYPKRLRKTTKKQELTFALTGLCGVTLYYLLENIALTYSMASNIGVIISIAPFFTAILSHFILKEETLNQNFIIGFMAAMVGIMLISFNGSSNFKLNPLGDILALLAALVWAVYSILTKRISDYGYSTIQVTRRTFMYGVTFMFLTLIPLGFKLDLGRFSNPIYLGNILFLGLGASALCFVTWNMAVKILGAVKTSIYIYIVPVVTVVTSIIVLHEQITLMAFIGTVLTFIGLFLSQKREVHKNG